MSGNTSIDTSEDRYRILLESTPLVPWEADARTWLFNYVGPQAAALLGYPVEDWYGDTFWVDRIHPDDRDATLSTCVRLSREGNDYEFEYRMIPADGTIAWICDVVSVAMENGEQPLSAIAANSQAARRFLAAKQPNTEEVTEALTDITNDAKRASEVIRRMRDLLMKRQLQREPVDMNEAISNVAGLLYSDAVSRQITVTLDLADELPTTYGDRTQLEQVMLNLMVNAFEAMTASEIDRRELVVRTFVGDTGSTEITVSDTGPGFQAGLDDIFEPFVTTKANGLGMGLSISRSIIDAHGGRLEAVHDPDGGATLHITLPAGGEDS